MFLGVGRMKTHTEGEPHRARDLSITGFITVKNNGNVIYEKQRKNTGSCFIFKIILKI